MSKKLEKNRKLAQKAGLALTVEDFVALLPKTTAEDNAEKDYRAAIKFVQSRKPLIQSLTNGTRNGVPARDAKAIAMTDSETRAALNELQPMFEAVAKGASKPHLNWNRDWSLGPALLLPEMAEIKQIVKLVCIRAKFRAKHDNAPGAIADYRSAAAICRQVDEEPLLISALVRLACESIVLTSISDTIGARPFDENLLKGLRGVIQGFGATTDVARVLQGEMLFQSTSMKMLAKGDMKTIASMFGANDGGGEDAKLVKLFAVPAVRDATFAYMLEKDVEIVESARRNRNDPHAWSRYMIDLQGRMDAEKSVTAKLASIFLPVFSEAGNAAARHIAMRRGATWMIDSLLAAHAKGVTSLGGIKPTAAPEDPFNHKPMIFKVTPKLIIAYSVGVNERDDGGDIFSTNGAPTDVGFSIGEKPKTRPKPSLAPSAAPAPAAKIM